jgi:hypothetical protein
MILYERISVKNNFYSSIVQITILNAITYKRSSFLAWTGGFAKSVDLSLLDTRGFPVLS